MKIRETIFNDLDFNEYYPRHDFEQHSKDFSHWSDTFRTNVGGTVTFKSYNSKSAL